MDFYLLLKSILLRPPPGKWVPIDRTVEGGSKIPELFTGGRWPLLQILLIRLTMTIDSHRSTPPPYHHFTTY